MQAGLSELFTKLSWCQDNCTVNLKSEWKGFRRQSQESTTCRKQISIDTMK